MPVETKPGGCLLDCLKTNLTPPRTCEGALFMNSVMCVSPHEGISFTPLSATQSLPHLPHTSVINNKHLYFQSNTTAYALWLSYMFWSLFGLSSGYCIKSHNYKSFVTVSYLERHLYGCKHVSVNEYRLKIFMVVRLRSLKSRPRATSCHQELI